MLSGRSGTATWTWKRFMAFSCSGLRGVARGATRLACRRGAAWRLAFLGATGRRAIQAVPGATVLGQVGEQRIHPAVVGRIEDEAAFLPARDELRMEELLQVEGERGRRRP